MGALTLQEALQIIHSREWYSLSVVTCNVKKGTAGKILDLGKCRIAHKQPSFAAPFPDEDKLTEEAKVRLRDPNHNLWFTRNVETYGGPIITIHPILVFRINNQFVL